MSELSPFIEVEDTPEAVLAAFVERQWCDGLPIVPPTEDRVRAMLGGRDPEQSLGAMPPLWPRPSATAAATRNSGSLSRVTHM